MRFTDRRFGPGLLRVGACICVLPTICFSAQVSGELKLWHKVTVTYTSPDSYSETGDASG